MTKNHNGQPAKRLVFNVMPTEGGSLKSSVPAAVSIALNPLSKATDSELESLLRSMCDQGLSPTDAMELDDQIEALVPAVIELRDGGHLELNARVLTSFGTLAGFMSLSVDDRLSDLSRRRCSAIRDRMIANSLKAIL